MTLEAKKLDIIQRILGISNETIVDQLSASVKEISVQNPAQGSVNFVTYNEVKSKDFNLGTLKMEQNYQPFAKDELDVLIKEADIQESIEELLEALN